MNRFSSGALLMYQLSPELSSLLPKYFLYLFEAIHRKGSGYLLALVHPLADSSFNEGVFFWGKIGLLGGLAPANG